MRKMVFSTALAAALMTGSIASAALTTSISAGGYSTVTLDGALGTNEYGTGNAQVYAGAGTGFGGVLNGNSLYVANNATNLYLALDPGADLNDIAVIYLNTKSGGFGDADMDDDGDGGRTVTSNLGSFGTDVFPASLSSLPDYAVVIGNFGVVVFELNAGTTDNHLTFVSFDGTFTGNSPSLVREVALPWTSIGMTGPGAVEFFAVYGAGSGFLSNESIPPSATLNAGSNPGNTATATYENHNLFTGYFETVYTWDGSASNDFATAANWTPDRTTPASSDVLVFDGSVTTTPSVTGLVTQTIRGIEFKNNVVATVTAPAAATITVAGGQAAYDFSIGAGSSLRITGNQAIVFNVAAAATGEVFGDLIFHATAAAISHKVIGNAVGAVIMRNGSTAAMAPVSTGANGGFGVAADGVANAITFESGSIYYQGGEKDGTFNGGTGSNPFARTAPASNVVFNPGSTYFVVSGIPATSNRTYGNYTWQGRTVTNQGGGSPLTVQNSLRIKGGNSATSASFSAQTGNVVIGEDLVVETGALGLNLNAAPTAAQTISIARHVDIQSTTGVTMPADTDATVLFNGTSAQNLNFAGLSLVNATLNNSAGANLTGNLKVTGALTLTSGNITTGANTLTLGTAATVTGSGLILGNLARDVNATVTGVRTLPIGQTPVSVDITSAGTGTGTIAVSLGTGPSQPLPIGAIATNRSWNLTDNGISGWTATVVFNYSDSELGSANENNLVAARYNGSSWDILSGTSTVNTTANTVTVTGVTAFSEWVLVDASATVADWTTLHE